MSKTALKKKIKKQDDVSYEKFLKGMESLRESQKQTDEALKKTDDQMKKTDFQMKRTDLQMKKTDLQMKKIHKRIKELNELFTGQWGKLMESLVEGDLIKLLKKKGIDVEVTVQNIKSKKWQLDIVAINGEEVVVVEVKTTLSLKDVDIFIGKLKEFKMVLPKYADKKVLGAVAYLKANEGSERNAEKKGLYVIRATGSSSSIINESGFKPRVF